MAVPIQPPPNGPIGDTKNWRDWFFSVWVYATQVATNTFNGLSFTGSNITSIVTRNHNDLTSLQGGTSLQYYHLTSSQQATVAALPIVTGLGVVNTSTTTVGAAGGASALPATPKGYITVNINGTDYKIPYYNL